MTDLLLPDRELAALLSGARWRRVAVLGDSIAEGVREPLDGYRDLSWIDRIAAPLRDAAPDLALLNLGRRNLLAAEVRASQLAPALAFRPDLAIVRRAGTTRWDARSIPAPSSASSSRSSGRCGARAPTCCCSS